MRTGLIAPSTDFRSVRDGRNSQIFYVDVALDTARSASGLTALELPISGNCFYIDARPTDGNAIVHFQDTNFDRGAVPLYVSPGSIFNIPFTRVLIENSAQAGKKIRIAYGVDIDFQPGSVAQLAVTNAGGYSAVRPEAPTVLFNYATGLAANTAFTIIAPGANLNGVIVQHAQCSSLTATPGRTAFLFKTAPPTLVNDGGAILIGLSNTTYFSQPAILTQPVYIAPGFGVYAISELAETAAHRMINALTL